MLMKKKIRNQKQDKKNRRPFSNYRISSKFSHNIILDLIELDQQ